MKRKSLFNRFAFYLNCAVISFSVSAVSLLGVTFVNSDGTRGDNILVFIIGLVFWSGIICEFTFLSKADKLRKRVEKKLSLKESKAKIGIMAFFRNREAMVSDIALFTFAIIMLLFSLFKVHGMFLYSLTFSLVFTALHFHSYFNGRNYRCLKLYKTYINNMQGATKNVQG